MLEWVELKVRSLLALLVQKYKYCHLRSWQRDINPLIVSEVAQQLARVHLCTEGMSSDYGFAVNTFLGFLFVRSTPIKGGGVRGLLTRVSLSISC